MINISHVCLRINMVIRLRSCESIPICKEKAISDRFLSSEDIAFLMNDEKSTEIIHLFYPIWFSIFSIKMPIFGEPRKTMRFCGEGGDSRSQRFFFAGLGEMNRHDRMATSGGVGDEDVGDGADELAVLQDGAAAHVCVNIGPTQFCADIFPLYAKKPHQSGAVSLYDGKSNFVDTCYNRSNKLKHTSIHCLKVIWIDHVY